MTCTCGYAAPARGCQPGQLVRCPACGAACRVGETTQPPCPRQADASLFEDDDVPAVSPPAAESGTAVEPPPHTPPQRWQAETCARCGKAFRGDWDRLVRPSGVVCHVCGNLATEVDRLGPSPSKIGPILDDPLSRSVEKAYSQPGWLDLDPKPETLNNADRRERRRHMLIYAGISAGILLTILVWPSEGGRFGGSIDFEELSPAAAWLLVALKIVLTTAAYAAALYFTLHMALALPYETIAPNLLTVGVMAFIVAFCDVAVSWFVINMLSIPLFGNAFAIFAGLIILLPLVALYAIYQLEWQHLLLFIAARFACLRAADALMMLFYAMVGGATGS